jgi:hypothetical protein
VTPPTVRWLVGSVTRSDVTLFCVGHPYKRNIRRKHVKKSCLVRRLLIEQHCYKFCVFIGHQNATQLCVGIEITSKGSAFSCLIALNKWILKYNYLCTLCINRKWDGKYFTFYDAVPQINGEWINWRGFGSKGSWYYRGATLAFLLRTYNFYSKLENALCRDWVSNMAYPECKSGCLSLH